MYHQDETTPAVSACASFGPNSVGHGVLRGVPVGELDADLVPTAGTGLRFENRSSSCPVGLDRLGELGGVHGYVGGGGKRCAREDGQHCLLRGLCRIGDCSSDGGRSRNLSPAPPGG